jgi:hypothetical protein
MSNLVELMVQRQTYFKESTLIKLVAEQMLSVVKEHIGEVAKVCGGELFKPCENGYWYEEINRDSTGYLAPKIVKHKCLKCKGSGVIARKDEA